MKLVVTKKNGLQESFDPQKIASSIESAGRDTKEFGPKIAKQIFQQVITALEAQYQQETSISVDNIRTIVEPTIAKAGYFDTAKYYILFAERKAHSKGKVSIKEPKLTDVGKVVMAKRYLRTDLDGKVVETPGEMLWRVARHIAKAEVNWSGNGIVDETARAFYERMVNWKFVCAGKAMFEAGNPGGTGQLSSCFVLPIEDSIHSIFKTLGDAAVVHKNNGGTGFNFSKIRPHGDKVKNVPNAASGPVDFIRAFSAALSQILQGAKRQGANIAVLNCDHPDIEEFIRLKVEDGTIKNFNISVGVTNEFMTAVQQNKDWNLINPRNGQIWKTLKARDLFDLIAETAWATGDPGLAFLDRLEEDNPTPSIGRIDATNPCGEIPLLPYESCNLTSIVLTNHLKQTTKGEWEIDWDDLKKSIHLGVRFLDDMIEVNTYALDAIRERVKEGNRRIGLGVMGFAHLLYRLRIPYNSAEAVRVAERIAKFMRQEAEAASKELASERGPFGNFDVSVYSGTSEIYRNGALLMIAPTGTTSLIADSSSGIEPIFSLVTVRRSFNEDSKNNAPTREFIIADPEFEQQLIARVGKKKADQIISQLATGTDFETIDDLTNDDKRIFVTTHKIKPEWHIKIQAAWQKWIDNSVSKTINFPHTATVDDVKKAYLSGWQMGLKGITIYRDGSKMDQVLNIAGKESKRSSSTHQHIIATNKPGVTEKTVCPECGAAAHMADGCVSCPQCGWSKCTM